MHQLTVGRFTRIGLLGLAFAVFSIAGCGPEAVPGAVKTYPSTGTITLDGKAFGPARLVFTPGDPNAPRPNGLVDNAGKITVTTYSSGDGMPAGTYKVTISSDPMTSAPEHPQLYNDVASSTLSVTITDKGPNEFKLDMDSKAGPMTSGPGSAIPAGVNMPPGVDPSKVYNPAPPKTGR